MHADRFLVDTNILVYAYDRSESVKQVRARQVLSRLVEWGTGVLSTQVLAEFFSAVTRKLTERMTPLEGYARLQQYARSWRVVGLTPEIILESARGVVEYQFPFYDAQIWATAKQNQISRVLSEDFSPGRRIESIEFVNPFVAKLPGEE
ncbi:MAG TPA: PIN domain-containing protein [Terriglobia bacterium]|nr:PIN domain-containing protein [Terriglobia bacterium]